MPADPEVSLILPTFNERTCLGMLHERIESALERYPHEIIVVDDGSPDGTAHRVRELSSDGPYHLVLRDRRRGLGSAVVEGIGRSRGSAIAVMDADGSHPPELLPALVEPVLHREAEFVLGSRRVPGGDYEGLTPLRTVTSWVASRAARGLTTVQDPMSGFLTVRREVLDRAPLRATGFKIGLEIITKCRPAPILEVPFHFGPRLAGRSKLTAVTVVDYVRQLSDLYRWRAAADGRDSRTR
jgi:dolichol-phosphate mannosyltransferase